MSINYLYLLDWARSISKTKPDAKILDYGCGAGEVVVAGREAGLDIYGADVFYGGGGASYKENVERLNLLGNVIREIKQGKLDFADASFDIVLSNQVFEHVENLELAINEISRVMKENAILLCLFPSKEVFLEGHIGIPFAHWLPKDSKLRYYYTLSLRSLEFGKFKQDKSKSQWTKDALDWIDKYTTYRKKDEIYRLLSPYFEINMIEADHIKYRLSARQSTKLFSELLKIPLVPKISQQLFNKLGGVVILAKKKELSQSYVSNVA